MGGCRSGHEAACSSNASWHLNLRYAPWRTCGLPQWAGWAALPRGLAQACSPYLPLAPTAWANSKCSALRPCLRPTSTIAPLLSRQRRCLAGWRLAVCATRTLALPPPFVPATLPWHACRRRFATHPCLGACCLPAPRLPLCSCRPAGGGRQPPPRSHHRDRPRTTHGGRGPLDAHHGHGLPAPGQARRGRCSNPGAWAVVWARCVWDA